MATKHLTVIFVGLCCALLAGVEVEGAGTVYVVPEAGGSTVEVYEIVGIGLTLLDTYQPSNSAGMGLALDETLRGSFLFMTFEGQNEIEVINAKNLEYVATVTAQNATNLSGIVVDGVRRKVYVINRQSDRLYSYNWDAAAETLTPAIPYPGYVELEDVYWGFGIALDEGRGILYVADCTKFVKSYSVSNWSKVGEFEVSHNAIGIDVNGQTKTAYVGSIGNFGENYPHLIEYSPMDDPNGVQATEYVGASIAGVAVRESTGYVYATTFGSSNDSTDYPWPSTADRVIAFSPYSDPNDPSSDPNTTLAWVSHDDLGDPAGIAVSENTVYKPSANIVVEKVAVIDPNTACVSPGDSITYEIVVRNEDASGHTNVYVTDILPYGVEYAYMDMTTWEVDPNYYIADHTYTWFVGDLPGYDPNSMNDPNVYLSITVEVTDRAEPASYLKNVVEVEDDLHYVRSETVQTAVCCWTAPGAEPNVIYVNAYADGANIGTCWSDAYTDLQSALAKAEIGCGGEIWIAQGMYSPGDETSDSFEIPDGIAVYGGFKATETARSQRDHKRYKTVLTGLISDDGEGNTVRNERVVEMGDGSLLDGVIVEEGGVDSGVYGSGVDFSIANCDIVNNAQFGVYAKQGDVLISWCMIRNNGFDGVLHENGTYQIVLENCKVYENSQNGIHTRFSVPTITNCMIYENGSESTGYYGVNISQPSNSPAIHNCTIVHNYNESIGFTGTYLPDVRNCILWGNNNDQSQLAGVYAEEVYFSCIPDCNDVNNQGNINEDPRFAYSYPEYGLYHLANDSNCIDAGDNTYIQTGEVDIDGDDRIYGSYVDMGADEHTCGDVANASDITGDGIINMKDFGVLAAAWRSHDPNDPAWLNDPSLVDPNAIAMWDGRVDYDPDYDIGLGDLAFFVDDAYWLWMACWRESSGEFWAMEAASLEVAVEEPTALEQYDRALEIVQFLENIWKNDAELRAIVDKKDWKRFMRSVKEWMTDLEDEL